MLTAGQFYSGPFHVQFVYKSTNIVSLFINVSKFPKFFTKYFPTIFFNFFKTSESTVITWLFWRFSRHNLTISGQILLAWISFLFPNVFYPSLWCASFKPDSLRPIYKLIWPTYYNVLLINCITIQYLSKFFLLGHIWRKLAFVIDLFRTLLLSWHDNSFVRTRPWRIVFRLKR